jgi:deoxyribose-phosphate aldolase
VSDDLQMLAREIARELAARDLASALGAPPEQQDRSAPPVERNHSVPARSISPHASRQTAAPPGVRYVAANARIADFIDHTLLKAESTQSEVEKLCDEAREHRFAAVCVNPSWVRTCATRLSGSGVQIATVIGFPLGATSSAAKRSETELAIADGATEIDMVAAIGHIKSGDWNYVADDIAAVVAGARGHVVKVIVESAVLTPVELIKACAIAREMGASYVKTSTGFHAAGGATAEAIALMRLVVGDALGVKASGGVRDCEAALKMIANGATRIGTSSGVSMVKCLGPGPLPVSDLLSLATAHAGACHTCAPGGSAAGSY